MHPLGAIALLLCSTAVDTYDGALGRSAARMLEDAIAVVWQTADRVQLAHTSGLAMASGAPDVEAALRLLYGEKRAAARRTLAYEYIYQGYDDRRWVSVDSSGDGDYLVSTSTRDNFTALVTCNDSDAFARGGADWACACGHVTYGDWCYVTHELGAWGAPRAGGFVGATSYDATTRPWWTGAVAANGSYWSPVYSDAGTGQPCLTASRRTFDRAGAGVGVLGIDFFLGGLSAALNATAAASDDALVLFLMEPSGLMVASSGGVADVLLDATGGAPAQRSALGGAHPNDAINRTARAMLRHLAASDGAVARVDGYFAQRLDVRDAFGLHWVLGAARRDAAALRVVLSEVEGAAFALDAHAAACSVARYRADPCACYGGAARRQSFVGAARARDARTLLIDTGAYAVGSGLFFPTFGGNASRALFGAARYDAWTLAYRELQGSFAGEKGAKLARYVARARAENPSLPLPVVTNMDFSRTALAGSVARHTLVTLDGGWRVAVLALLGDTQFLSSFWRACELDASAALATTLADLARLSEPPDAIICLAAQGNSEPSYTEDLALRFMGKIDAWLNVDWKPYRGGPSGAYMVSSWEGSALLVPRHMVDGNGPGTLLSDVTLHYSSPRALVSGTFASKSMDCTIPDDNTTQMTMYGAPHQSKSVLAAMLAFASETETEMSATVAHLSTKADGRKDDEMLPGSCAPTSRTVYPDARVSCGCESTECTMGSFQADAMRHVMAADIGAQNAGGIGEVDFIGNGSVTKKDIYESMPRLNDVVKLELPGSAVLQALRDGVAHLTSVENAEGEICPWGRSGCGLLHLSGVSFKWRHCDGVPWIDEADVLVGGEPLDVEASYSFATSSYNAQTRRALEPYSNSATTWSGGASFEAAVAYLRDESATAPGISIETGRMVQLPSTRGPCECPAGEFWESNSTQCSSCHLDTFALHAAGRGACSTCPSGATCEGGTFVPFPRKGHWVNYESSEADLERWLSSSRAHASCLIPTALDSERCLGAARSRPLDKDQLEGGLRRCSRSLPALMACLRSNFSLCDEGTHGVLCGICDDGWHKEIGAGCAKCGTMLESWQYVLSCAALVIAVVALLTGGACAVICAAEVKARGATYRHSGSHKDKSGPIAGKRENFIEVKPNTKTATVTASDTNAAPLSESVWKRSVALVQALKKITEAKDDDDQPQAPLRYGAIIYVQWQIIGSIEWTTGESRSQHGRDRTRHATEGNVFFLAAHLLVAQACNGPTCSAG